MKKKLVIIILLLSSLSAYSQSSDIVGSWFWHHSNNTILFFIKENGTIEKRTGLNTENIGNKDRQTGTYIFNKKAHLTITWDNKIIEKAKVKFIDRFTAEIQFTNSKNKVIKTYIFKRIIDEEVTPDK